MTPSGPPPSLEVAAFGTWPSPITPELLVQGAAGAADLRFSEGRLWWLESRPQEAGRVQLVTVRLDGSGVAQGEATDLLPDGFSARTRVHEYGGGALWVSGECAFVTSWEDQRIYRVEVGKGIDAISPEPDHRHGLRFADGDVSPDGEWIACVMESHHLSGASEPSNSVVLLPTDGRSEPVTVVAGHDFVARPRWSPSGEHLSWITWEHPDMGWDSSEVRLARVSIGSRNGPPDLFDERVVAGGNGESVSECAWDPEGRLWFASDRTGWWNLWRLDDGHDISCSPDLVVEGPAEMTLPHWVFGVSRIGFPGKGLAVVAQANGVDRLLWAGDRDVPRPELVQGVAWSSFPTVASAGGALACVAASFSTEPEVVTIRMGEDGSAVTHTARPCRDLGIDARWLSIPEHVTFPTGDLALGGNGEAGDRAGGVGVLESGAADSVAHALLYMPASATHRGPDGGRPPLVVMIHGGPTSAARSQLQFSIQFWTSRGFVVADVNYRGSVGYGREYRTQLEGWWGVRDVEDCVAVAGWLAAEGRVDAQRMAIRGSSAGGFTTLCALAFHSTFSVGTSAYGVVDLCALATDTHKFESRYLDRLIGPWPDAEETYRQRSPINHADSLRTPLLVLQGSEDEIVPPNQAELLVEALRQNGVDHEYVLFEGEQHGWRQASTIVRALEVELAFVTKVMGLG